MNIFLKRQMMDENNGENQGGSGGGQSQEGQSNNQNNSENNLPDYSGLWDNTPPKNENQQQQTQQQQTQQQQTVDPNTAMANHIASLNLTNGIDSARLMSDIREGNSESMQTAFSTLAANAYQAAVTDMNRLVDARVKKGIEESTGSATGAIRSDLAIRELQSALPFTQKPEIEPVAKAVFTQFMKKGQDVKGAIESTKNYFKHMSKMAGDNQPPRGMPGTRNFNQNNGSSGNADANAEDTDWLALLGAPE